MLETEIIPTPRHRIIRILNELRTKKKVYIGQRWIEQHSSSAHYQKSINIFYTYKLSKLLKARDIMSKLFVSYIKKTCKVKYESKLNDFLVTTLKI